MSLFLDIKKHRSFFLILSVLCLFSCGLSDDTPTNLDIYDLDNLETSCPLNTDNLGKLLEQDVSSDIDCLETSLDQFVDFVRREDDNYINRTDLNKFIDKFFSENSELSKKLLKLVYDINTLLLRDPEDKISVSKLNKLFSLFRIANNEGQTLHEILSGLNSKNYWQRRQEIFIGLDKLALKINDIIRPLLPNQKNNTITNYELDIENFLIELSDILELDDTQLDIKKIKSFLFIKKLILGGKSFFLTSNQMNSLLDKISQYVILGMDVLNVKDKSFQNDTEEYFFYYDVLKEFQGHFHPFSENEPIFEHQNIEIIVDTIFEDEYNFSNMEESVFVIKEKFIGGTPERYQFKDVNKLMDLALQFSGMLYFNQITYQYYNDILNSPDPVGNIRLPQLENYNIFKESHIKIFWEQFSYITKNFRYFHDSDGLMKFDSKYHRSTQGVNTASMLRWALNKVMKVYLPTRKEVNKDDLTVILDEFGPLAKELDFWPNNVERFKSEVLLGSDLFMYHADGTGKSGLEEITEYAVNALHGYKLTDQMHMQLSLHCDRIADGESFDIHCVREHFTNSLFNELKLDHYFPKLKEYYENVGHQEMAQYLIYIELYARINPALDAPVTKEDLSRILVIVSSLESAFLRYDRDNSGILERGELDTAHLVFKGLIDGLVDLDSDSLKKSIFLYLVKHMEIPSAPKLFWFHAFGAKKNIISTRFNISAILQNFRVD